MYKYNIYDSTRSNPRTGSWTGPRRGAPPIVLLLAISGCASETQLVWPTPPPGTVPTLTVERVVDPSAPVAAKPEPASIRSALPPALLASLGVAPVKPASGTTADAKRDPETTMAAATSSASRGGDTKNAPGPKGVEDSDSTAPDAKRDPETQVAAASFATGIDPPVPVVPTPPVVPPAPMDYPIDLNTALRLAEVENPEIAEARTRIREALGVLQGAMVLALPTLNAGLNYHGHTGNLQRSSGRILNLSEQSLYYGGGARTLAAESLAIPAVNIVSPLADVLFEPLVANQEVTRSKFAAVARTNSVLLEVAERFFDLIGAEASLELWRQTEAEGKELARLTSVYAQTGQGRDADANRAGTLALLLRRDVQKAEEEVAVASANLAHRLHLTPVVRIHPVVPRIEPIPLIDERSRLEDLVKVALDHRPEIGARAAAVGVAETRFHQERSRPLLPTLWLGFSGGAFGGGSNLVPPFLGNFGGRTDFDVRAYWTLNNMGIGNLAIIKQRRTEIGVALGEQSQVITRIRREVGAALAEVLAARGRIGVTERQLATAMDGFREDLTRIRGTVGLPIEATNSLELLSNARQKHLMAIIDYDRAQFSLFVALGSPPPLSEPPVDPLPPAPIASPPLPLPPVALFSFPGIGSGSSDGTGTNPDPAEMRVPVTPPPMPAMATSPPPMPVPVSVSVPAMATLPAGDARATR